MKVYVLVLTTGSYEDTRVSNEGVYAERAQAVAYAEAIHPGFSQHDICRQEFDVRMAAAQKEAQAEGRINLSFEQITALSPYPMYPLRDGIKDEYFHIEEHEVIE